MKRLHHPELLVTAPYVNGQWQETAATFEVRNPASGELL